MKTFDSNPSTGKSEMRADKSLRPSCSNCHKPGRHFQDCWSRGGGKEGQGPRSRGGRLATKARRNPRDHFVMMARRERSVLPTIQTFILDSGASDHMVGDTSIMNDFETASEMPISLADNSTISAIGHGSIQLKCGVNIITLKKVLYVPATEKTHLLSVEKLTAKGADV